MAWTDEATCVVDRVPMDVFFPAWETNDALARARAVCDRCPVSTRCLEEAMHAERGQSRSARAGIYGGRTPAERAQLMRRRQKDARQRAVA